MFPDYVIITPCRDEEQSIEATIQCMVNQTHQPKLWIIVNDGSTDNTQEIILKYAKIHSWILPVCKENRGHRQLGAGVVEAFNYGYNILQIMHCSYDYIGKFDADLYLPSDYFEILINKFIENPKLALAGGTWMIQSDRDKKRVLAPEDFVPGMAKFYRKKCFKEIHGLEPMRLFDLVDIIKLQMLGYETCQFSETECIQLRKMDQREKWQIKSKFEKGAFYHYIGYHPVFMFIKWIKQSLTESPYFFLGSFVYAGYLYASIFRHNSLFNIQIKKFLRKKQVSNFSLLFLKKYFNPIQFKSMGIDIPARYFNM